MSASIEPTSRWVVGSSMRKEVRWIKQQLDEREPGFFAAAQHPDRFEDIVAAEEK